MAAVAEAATEHSVEVHLLELRRVAQSLRERDRLVRQCEAWRDRLTRPDSEVVVLREEFAAIAHGAMPASKDLANRVETCAATAEAEADQRYAEHVLIEELEKLGYWLDTTLETVTAGDGRVLLAHPNLDDAYRVELCGHPQCSRGAGAARVGRRRARRTAFTGRAGRHGCRI